MNKTKVKHLRKQHQSEVMPFDITPDQVIKGHNENAAILLNSALATRYVE